MLRKEARFAPRVMKLKDLLAPENRQKLRALILNIGGILILNVTIQFILYPFIERRLGYEALGVALSMLSVVSITANTFGTAAAFSRLVRDENLHPANGDYNLILLAGGVLSALIGVGFLSTVDYLNPL